MRSSAFPWRCFAFLGDFPSQTLDTGDDLADVFGIVDAPVAVEAPEEWKRGEDCRQLCTFSRLFNDVLFGKEFPKGF